jgi:DNA recombination protein RmuC
MLWRRKTEMSLVVMLQLVVLLVVLIAVVVLLMRKPPVPGSDPRLAQLPEQIARLEARTDARSEALGSSLRDGLGDLRREANENALAAREAAARDFGQLRTEITGSIATLGATLQAGLGEFRADNAASAAALAKNVQAQLDGITQRLSAFVSEANRSQIESRESLNAKLGELGAANSANLDKIRATVEASLTKLNADNRVELDKMRQTVDEKLQITLQTRLTESFGQVTKHLGDVQKGLGEMKELATGVGDLKKVLSNVKSRGVVGEFQLGMQLEQMFAPDQYIKNARIKPDTLESVEYALKFPSGDGPDSHTLLAIDAKFPKEDWERLEHAYDNGSAEEIAAAGRAFERAIRAEGKRICDKYIDPPTTMPHAIMFLPTENLYAEVVRRPGLQSEVQANCRVTIAGPSTFMAILTSFQMGFHTLAIQKKGDEVWRVLSSTKNEFEKFGGLMDKVRKQVDTVQNTLGEIGGKTKTINRALKNVSSIDTGDPIPNLLGFDEIAAVAPLLAAGVDED